jgi:hypothetical protein
LALGSYPPGLGEPCITILLVTFKDSELDASSALQLAEGSHPPDPLVRWFCRETTLEQEYNYQATAYPSGHRNCAENAYINNDADVSSVLERAFTTLPSKKTFTIWLPMSPCSRRPLPSMALSMQSDHYFALYAIWEDEKDDQRFQAWSRSIMKDVERDSTGAYLGDSDFQVRRTRFWGEEEGRKLMEIRRKWDPNGQICGYLDAGDQSGVQGLENIHEWQGEGTHL